MTASDKLYGHSSPFQFTSTSQMKNKKLDMLAYTHPATPRTLLAG